MKNVKIVVCAIIAFACAGITIFKKARENKINRDQSELYIQERRLKEENQTIDAKAAAKARELIIKRLENGARWSDAELREAFNTLEEFEKITLRFER